MKKNIGIEISLIAMVIAPFVYLGLVYESLPEMVPTHFNMSGEPDDFSSKFSLIFILLTLNLFIYLLFLIIPKIAPSKFNNTSNTIYNKLRFGMGILIAALSCLMVYMANGDPLTGIRILGLVFVFLCLFLGNYLQAVRKNYFIGIRTPWTLSSDEVWKKTHTISGKLLFYGGLLSIPFVFLIPPNLSPIPSVGVLLASMIFGAFYSLYLFKKEQKTEIN